MLSRLARIFLFGIFLFSFAFAAFEPALAQSGEGIVNCATRANDVPCTMCHFLVAAVNILRIIMRLMTLIGIAFIFAMGILYVVSAGNDKLTGQAKAGIKAVLIGFALILASWLIVNFLLSLLANSNFLSNFQQTGTFTFTCSTASSANSGVLPSYPSGGAPSSVSTVPRGPVGGTCQAPGSGACAPANLGRYCFAGQNVNAWSQICNVESGGGNVSARSGTDICLNHGRRSFSGGLFQINIFSHGSRLGDARCNNLGSKGSCAPGQRRSDGICLGWNCDINNVADFDHCMGLTFTEAGNTRIACAISNQGHNTQPWLHTANRCGIPRNI